jgi:hypothetical protein
MTILREGRGTQWDAEIVDVMVRIAAAERNRSADAGLPLTDLPLREIPGADTRAV